jgi:hypothetical protein
MPVLRGSRQGVRTCTDWQKNSKTKVYKMHIKLHAFMCVYGGKKIEKVTN